MGNTSSVPGSASGGSGHKFTPSDGFFLSESAAQGNVEVLGLFLAKNPALVWAVSATDHSTPWHNAAERGHVDALQLLVSYSKQGALSNTFEPTSKACCQVNSLGQSPLMLACKQGHTQAVQLLLAHGSNLFLRDKAGATALHYAALHPAGGCVPLLLKQAGLWGPKGPRLPATGNQQLALFVNAADVPYGRTALHCACWSGQLDGVVSLLAAGADLLAKTSTDCFEREMPCNHGTTPLHLAAMRGHQSVCVVLMAAYVRAVRRGASLPDPRTLLDGYSKTPHSIAAFRRHHAPLMMELLQPSTALPELQRFARRAARSAQRSGSRVVRDAGEGAPRHPDSPAGPDRNGTCAADGNDADEERFGYGALSSPSSYGSSSEAELATPSVPTRPAAQHLSADRKPTATTPFATVSQPTAQFRRNSLGSLSRGSASDAAAAAAAAAAGASPPALPTSHSVSSNRGRVSPTAPAAAQLVGMPGPGVKQVASQLLQQHQASHSPPHLPASSQASSSTNSPDAVPGGGQGGRAAATQPLPPKPQARPPAAVGEMAQGAAAREAHLAHGNAGAGVGSGAGVGAGTGVGGGAGVGAGPGPPASSLQEVGSLAAVYSQVRRALAAGTPLEAALGVAGGLGGGPPLAGSGGSSAVASPAAGAGCAGDRHPPHPALSAHLGSSLQPGGSTSTPTPARAQTAGSALSPASCPDAQTAGCSLSSHKHQQQPPPQQQQQQQPPGSSRDPVPDFCLCPLTLEVMRDPVVAADGHSYEREALLKYLATGSLQSPVTRKKLTTTTLYPNHALRGVVEYMQASQRLQQVEAVRSHSARSGVTP